MVESNGIDNLNGVSSEESSMQIAAEVMGAPPIDIKLFVGRVPQTMDEAALKPVFEEFGEVKEVIVIRDKTSGKHKSSAFVKMASLSQADAAIRSLNNSRVLESTMGPMQVKYAVGEAERLGLSSAAGEPGIDQAKLFVGSLPKTITEEEIVNLFAPYGKVDEVFIMKDSASGSGKGCAFVKFAFKEQALHAMRNLNAKHTIDGCTRPMEVRFAESRAQRQQPMQGGNQMGVGGAGGGGGGGGGGYQNRMSVGGIGNMQQAVVPNNSQPRCAGPWKEYFTQDCRAYYHNEYTGVTQWDRPPEFDSLYLPPNQGGSGGVGGGGGAHGNSGDISDSTVTGPAGANVFVFHIPNEWTQRDLINAFGGFGQIVSARIATDKHTNRNRGYAFVSFADVEMAAAAVNHMNGFMALNKRLKVTIKKGEEMHVQHLLNNQNSGGGGSSNLQQSAAPQQQQQWNPYGMPNAGAAAYGQAGAQRFAPY